MYRTRTDRIKAERKQKRRRQSWLMVLTGTLLGVFLLIAAYLNLPANPPNEISQPGETDHPPQPIENGALPGSETQAGSVEPQVNLTFVGDVMMSGNVETMLKENGYDYPYAHVSSIFQRDDYTIANLETPVTKIGTPANKEYVYKSPPEAVPPLKASGVDLVNLANNHSMDQGVDGLLDTFKVLDANDVKYVGAGTDANRAYEPVLVERNGIKLAFLGFSRVVPEVSWYAGKNKPGLAVSYDPTRAIEAIRRAKEKADLVIVIAHWGKEKEDYPVDHQRDLARRYIDAGADLIIGGHPHVLQGFEWYKNKWIAYSLGNFIFTRSSYAKTWETMVLQATCTKQSCDLKMLPYRAELGRSVPMNEEDGRKLLERVEAISTNVRIESDGTVKKP
ncbi:CapA family protein [Brevibacillus sp. H7]|uniref:CapA family protein n=1 Tax=Brevibacillus sp. H7 TaxID=3349138 RepID=UPI0037F68617